MKFSKYGVPSFDSCNALECMQRATLERSRGGYPVGTLIYTSGKDPHHNEWSCTFPDDSPRRVANDDLRLCW
jgi:hypothetical protein